MQDILTHSPALVVDDKLKGLVPFLPLNLPAPGRSAARGAARRHTVHCRRPRARRNGVLAMSRALIALIALLVVLFVVGGLVAVHG